MKSKLQMSHQCALVAMRAVCCAVLGRGIYLFPLFGTHEMASGVRSSFWEPFSTGERLQNVSGGTIRKIRVWKHLM